MMYLYDYLGNQISIESEDKPLLLQTGYKKQIASSQGNQGCCTDGTYLYSADTSSKVYKYSILEKTSTNATSSIALDHANDMTYNPNTNRLYIATMDNNATIAVINPETLSAESSIILRNSDNTIHRCYALCYDRKNNQYITGDSATEGLNYSFFDSNFNFIKTITITRNESYTIQGIETDGKFIYRALWESDTNKNFIYVHDMDMNYLDYIEIPQSGELEAIAYDWSGNWYATYNARTGFYIGFNTLVGAKTIETLHNILEAYA